MNIAILNFQDTKELQYTLDCLEFIDQEIIDANIDIFCKDNCQDQISNIYIKNLFPIDLNDLKISDLNLRYSQLRSYSKKGKYHIAVDTECSFKSAITAYILSGRTAGFKKAGFIGKIISKFYDETIVYDEIKDKRELTYLLLAKTFGFENKAYQPLVKEEKDSKE